MKKESFIDKLKYFFDNTMSKGTAALIGWLAIISIALTFVISLVAWILGAIYGENFLHQVWVSLMYTITLFDPTDGYDWPSRIAMLLIIVVGLFATSILIGVLTSGIESKVEALRKGRSRVIEKKQTIILGWSQSVFPIMSELISANRNNKKFCIVILGEKDKIEMEDEIRDKVEEAAKVRIVCRNGNPIEISDLKITSPNTAKSIILLPSEEDDSDAGIVKTLLAITRNKERRQQPYHIVAEIKNSETREVANIIGKGEVELIVTGEFIARIMAQTCLQSGLSMVYNELFEFSGDEIYFKEEPGLTNKSFKDALRLFEDSSLIGLQKASGETVIKPLMDTVIQKGDRIIAISEDDSTLTLSPDTSPKINEQIIKQSKASKIKPVKIIILGWNNKGPTIVSELDNYLTRGSKVTIFAQTEDISTESIMPLCRTKNHTLSFQYAKTTNRSFLDSLPLASTSHVIIIPYTNSMDMQEADARTLTTLLHLRDISSKQGYNFSIVSEMIDVRNRQLAEADRADDFVVSEKLTSLILTQIAENKSLAPVFSILLNPGSVEIYLKPVTDYIEVNSPVNFYTILEAAGRREEIAIGYRIFKDSKDMAKKYGVVLNPEKSQNIEFSDEDFLIVIAEG